MDVDIPDIGIDIPEVSQIAFVVADLDAAMERYRAILGVEPWEVYRIGPPEQTEGSYYGESANPSFSIGYAYRGDLEIEIIEPVDGHSVHRDFLNRDEEGIHHIACFDFEDPYKVADAFEDAGLPIVQSGHWHDTHYIYFDTTAVLDGLYFETLAGGDIDPGPEYVFPDD
jgi:methylmalonyl-CoA/ethylmalonyl-CoA epimerase